MMFICKQRWINIVHQWKRFREEQKVKTSTAVYCVVIKKLLYTRIKNESSSLSDRRYINLPFRQLVLYS